MNKLKEKWGFKNAAPPSSELWGHFKKNLISQYQWSFTATSWEDGWTLNLISSEQFLGGELVLGQREGYGYFINTRKLQTHITQVWDFCFIPLFMWKHLKATSIGCSDLCQIIQNLLQSLSSVWFTIHVLSKSFSIIQVCLLLYIWF